jgi:hypothetical protein
VRCCQDYKIHLNEREAEGKVKRYLPVQVRVEGKWIAFSEIIVGPNRNIEDSRDELKKLLADQGYEVGDIEFPEITALCDPALGCFDGLMPPRWPEFLYAVRTFSNISKVPCGRAGSRWKRSGKRTAGARQTQESPDRRQK